VDVTTYRFADIEVDLARMQVRRGGEDVAVEPKAFDVLRFLIEHRDRLVTKDELLDQVWRDTFVTPNVLTRAVAQLRKALGDEAREARIIETAAKRGYRFIAVLDHDGAPKVAPIPPPRHRIVPIAASLLLLMIVGVIGWVALEPRDAWEPPYLAARRLTTRAGYNGQPAISPDGRSFAYVSDVTGYNEIVVSGLVAGGRELAVTSDGRQNVQPEWSPDGQWIAYHAQTPGGVWIVPATGGQPRQIVEFGSDPAWAPGSDRLAFTSDAGGMVAQSTIWTVRRDGSDRKALTRQGDPKGGHRSPSWSADGRFVVFAASTGNWDGEVWVISVADGKSTKVGQSYFPNDPRFTITGDAVLWTGIDTKGHAGLWRASIDRDSAAPRGRPAMMMPVDGGFLDGLTMSNDGTLAYSIRTADDNLWSVRISPDARALAEPEQLTRDAVRAGHPDYSVTGRVTFDQIVVGQPSATWAIDDDGKNREAVITDRSTWAPVWGRDGKRVLVVDTSERESRMLWVDMSSRRTTPVPIPPNEVREIHNARMSPIADEIAYHTVDDAGVMNVWIRPLDNSPPRQITHDTESISYPSWSPDGKRLAVEVKRGDQTSVGVVGRDGGEPVQLTSERGQSWPHSWSPDGEWITFAGERGGVWNVYAVSPRTREVRQITKLASPSGWVRYPSWSPRGGRLVFEREISSGAVWMLPVK